MKTTINVNRMQYGVGQGGFHCQEITVQQDGRNLTAEPYRFVYDCGSDTGSYVKKLPKPLDWAIKHFASNKISGKRSKVVIDTLYLSHFHKDHINGAVSLSNEADVREIVIPYVTVSQMVHIFAQQVAAGSIASTGPDDLQYVQILVKTSGDEPLIEGIHTTRVEGSESEGEPIFNDNDVLPKGFLDLPEFSAEEYRIQHGAKQISWNHQSSRRLSLAYNLPGHKGNAQFWELRVWSYAQSESVSMAVEDALGALVNDSGEQALSNLLQGKFDQSEVEWAVENSTKISEAYKAALKSEGMLYPNDNVVSLCLHSAPLHKYQHIGYVSTLTYYDWPRCFLCRDDPFSGEYKGWVGTGDALLGKPEIWAKFEAHYTPIRIKGWSTIQIPHHGSKGVYFNSGLLDGYPKTAVISSGAFSKYHHPAMSTLEKIADKGGLPVVVTEMMRPGFFERLIYECN